MPATSSLSLTLVSLLPSYTPSTLPAPLVHLSESLLAQSRQRAAHLKPDEEIARAHACCEIACTRLRAKLRLPAPKTGGAPCKPAAYRKLVAFLGGVLGEEDATGTPTGTPGGRGKKRTADGAIKPRVEETELERKTAGRGRGRTSGAHVTPSKSNSTTRGKGNPFLGKVNGLAHKDAAEEAPRYVMPLIRRLCRAFATPLLAPHVYTGVCVVLKLDGLWPPAEDEAAAASEKDLEETVTGLLVALYLMTLTRMQTASKMTTSVYRSTCARAVEVLGYTPGVKGVEGWIRKVNQRGYARGQEWFGSVPERVFEFDPDAGADEVESEEEDDDDDDAEEDEADGQEGRDEEDHEDDLIISGTRRRRKHTTSVDDDEDEDPDGVLLPGLHTMMHHGLDFLGEERTREFEKWKKQFLQRLDRLDRSPAVQPDAVAVGVKVN
ncbi:hypothetical protein PV04_08820 [Phialophora macrospora]|uniref:ORC6 first cyclin-like domain-containing protein n=1 Tax=Phialophora macrospora TaxID=1851006 RepID=A0A0D2F791_9EURO|nr:hypothetical protein PV04_08820 [Phialophora macrospora]